MTEQQTRRVGDPVLNDLSTKVALLEQAQRLGTDAEKARAVSVDRAFDAVNAKLDRILEGQDDPDKSPGGRALRKEIGEVRTDLAEVVPKVNNHEELRLEMKGALRMARLAIGVAGLSALGQFAALAADILGRSPK